MYIGVGKCVAQGSYVCKPCTAISISFTPVHASTFPHQRETMKTSEHQLAPSHSVSAHFSLLAMTKARCVTRNDRLGCCLHQTHSHTPVVLAQEGKVFRLNMALPQLLMANVIQRIPIIFITKPVLAMSATLRYP